MAKISRKSGVVKIAFSRLNYYLFGASALILAIGYWALSQPPVNGFLSLTFAPVMLVIGYCVMIPAAIMVDGEKKHSGE